MKFIAVCYQALEARRGWLLLGCLLMVVAAAGFLTRIQVADSIVAMLPDGDVQVKRDFDLLQKTPFARKLVILLQAEDGVSEKELISGTQRLSFLLPKELFKNVQSGPGNLQNFQLVQQLPAYFPVLADEADLGLIADKLTPEQVDRQMAENLAMLMQPQGIAVKQQIQSDPLGLNSLALRKLMYINPLPGVRIEQGTFLSDDRQSSLILADTDIIITDPVGGKQLMDGFRLAKAGLPKGISATLLSGHPYTLANTEVIKSDMNQVLLVSGLGLLAIFVVFLRRWQALAVFLLPFVSMVIGLLVTSWFYRPLSGITIGFGAVLLGITIDYGLHVYFALRCGSSSRKELLVALSRPVLFGGLTTLIAFAVLLRSELPGQRQLAVFAVAGIVTALVLALLVLPHFIGKNEPTGWQPQRFRRHLFERRPRLRWLVLGCWLLIMVFSAVEAQQLSINGELKRLSYVPPELNRAEQAMADHWGNMRGRAMLFAQGEDLESALQHSEQVWQVLKQHQLDEVAVGLTPLLLSAQTQRKNAEQWQAYWSQEQPLAEELLADAGRKFGFTAQAFTPFIKRLEQEPQLLNLETLTSWGMGPLVENFIQQDADGVRLLTLIPDRPDVLSRVEEELKEIPGITLVSQSRFGRQLSQAIAMDFSQFISFAGLAVVLLLVILFRRLSDVLLAILPVLSGLLFMFGGMTWLGLEMNLFNVVASILIIGLGVDYGIFMTCHSRQSEDLASSRAVLVSGLTTLVGFGALVIARHPAMNSIGITVLLGIAAAVPTAVLVIPALRVKRL